MTAVLGVRVDRVRSCVHSGAPQDSSIGLLMEQGIDGPQLLYVLRDHAYPAPHCTCLLYSWIMDRHGAHDHAVQRVGVRRLREAGGRDRVHDAGPLSGRRPADVPNVAVHDVNDAEDTADTGGGAFQQVGELR